MEHLNSLGQTEVEIPALSLALTFPNTNKYLTEAVAGQLESMFNQRKVTHMTEEAEDEKGVKVHTHCVNRHESVPLMEIKKHTNLCRGGN